MAKPGVAASGAETSAETAAEAVPAMRVKELQRELRRLLKAILDGDSTTSLEVDAIDRALDALASLRDMTKRKRNSLSDEHGGAPDLSPCPERFRCPLSKQLMRDPVVVATGQTFDRAFIQKWLDSGHRTCPQTQQLLSHTLLTPNHLVRDMISEWCHHQRRLHLKLLPPDSSLDRLFSLLDKLSSSISAQTAAAAKELRLLTKTDPSFRALLGQSAGSVSRLLNPLLGKQDIPPDLHEELITTLLNLSIHDANKKLIAETPRAISLLIDALTRAGTIQTRTNAAAALFTLSAVDSNKALIGRSGALRPLLDLLDEGNPLAMNDAASAVFSLCIVHENRARAVQEGAIQVILTKIKENSHVDQLLSILAMLSTHPMAVQEMENRGGVQCLLNVIRETSCGRNKENCVTILYSMCMSNQTKLRELRNEEHVHGTISQLAQDGTARAKRKASGILDRLNRPINLTHTA